MEKQIKRDGHIHTPFCRHGSKDALEAYVEEAIRLGREKMSFTEHFPLPENIASREFILECSLTKEEVPAYLEAIEKLQQQYKGKICILRGFEVDYVEDKEEEITANLNAFGPRIQDSILSVHFVKYEGKYYAIDCLDGFSELLEKTKSLQTIYDLYFNTLLKAVKSDLGPYKPKRMGHPSLVRIFNQKYPFSYDDQGLFEIILDEMKARDQEIDFNSAGLRKLYCQESYPSGKLLQLAKEKKIRLVPGSDAHEAIQMTKLDALKDLMDI